MPRNGSGVYTLPPVYLATPGTTIRSDQHNTPMQDIEAALTASLPRNGSAPMTGPLAMGGRRITGLGLPTDDSDAARKAYVDNATDAIFQDRLRMSGVGILGSTTAALGAPATLGIGSGLEFNGTNLRVQIGNGISFGSAGAVTADVARFATLAEAQAGDGTAMAMTPLNVRQYANNNIIGMQQTWQDVTASRTFDANYRNLTGKPIMVGITADAIGANRSFQVSANGTNWITVGAFGESSSMWSSVSVIVPDTHYYRILGEVGIITWSELR